MKKMIIDIKQNIKREEEPEKKNDIIKIRKYQENYYLDYLDVLKRMECYGTKKEKKTNKKNCYRNKIEPNIYLSII